METTAEDDELCNTGDELGRIAAEELPMTAELEDTLEEGTADDELAGDRVELEERITAEELDARLTAVDEDVATELGAGVEVGVEVDVEQLCVTTGSLKLSRCIKLSASSTMHDNVK